MDKIIIRKLQPTDAEEVSRISSSITGSGQQADYQNVIKVQAQNPADASLVALKGRRMVGYCISHILAGSFGIEKSAWVAHFAVEPDFMGQGIGELLAKETLKHYKALGVLNVFTSVSWDATDLVSFYKTLGFQRSDFVNLYKRLE